ncbi:MAG: beta-propeller fold lactonase family protein [Gemmatimonadota bacterium]|nr:beta-propeller fold lactonase family protein [Gemmatimonadota bacterium]
MMALFLVACAPRDAAKATGDSSHARAAAGSRGYLFVSNEGSDDVSVIDVANDTVVATVPVGKRPRGIHLSPDGKTLFVAVSGSPRGGPGVDESKLPPADKAADGIAVVDVATRKVVRRLPGGSDPETFALSPDGKTLYVSNEDAGTASVIDVDKGTIIATIPVGAEPEGVAASPDGKTIIVTSEGKGEIAMIDAARTKVVATIAVGKRPRSATFTRDGSRAYVSAEVGATVSEIDVPNRKLLRTIPVAGDGTKPMGIVLAPDERNLLLATGRRGDVVAISLDSAKLVRAVHVGDRPWGIALSARGTELYSANGPSNTVSVIDLAMMRVVRVIPVGKLPWGVAVSK